MGSHCLNLLSRATAELEQSEESTPTPPVMFRVVLVSCLAAAACGQSLEAKNAKILKEQRFDAGDGRFGSAFAQEDGTVFREETTADGERIGQYSYIDENGQTITVRYTAGKDGFRILEGSHIPEGANGLQSAPFDPEIANGEPEQPQAAPVTSQPRPVRPAPQRQQVQSAPVTSQPRIVRPAQQRQQFQPQPQFQNTEFNPFINPSDPSHLDFQTNVNAAQFQPRPAQAPVQRQQFQQAPVQRQETIPNPSSVPACANCAGVNPFINPADSSHAQLFSSQQLAPASTFVPQPSAPAFQPQQPLQPAFATPSPQQSVRQPVRAQLSSPNTLNDFQGQLSLNRFDTGFNFDFSS